MVKKTHLYATYNRFISKERIQKMKVWKKIIHANRNKKKPGLALLISKKCILKQRLKKDKEHYIMIK